MTRNEKIIAIVKEFAKEKTIAQASADSGIPPEAIRTYCNVLCSCDVMERIFIENRTDKTRYAYKAKKVKLDADMLLKLDLAIYRYYKENKELSLYRAKNKKPVERYLTKAELEEIRLKDLEAANNEKKGIYLLSSKPSQYFKDKFKAQNQQAINERKSPKNYAGTSAGMVW